MTGLASQRWAACVAYDGTAYSGWQTQTHAPNIQDVVAAALSVVANHAVQVVASGRTDAGVHALSQIVHFDSPSQRDGKAWAFGANSNLPADICLRWAKRVGPDFHARHAARARHYRYVIFNHRCRSALFPRRAAHCSYALDVPAMQAAGKLLLGERDFSAFRAAGCQSRTPMRNVHAIVVARQGDYVTIDIRANAFLHHMVRNIAGSLIDVGRGRRPVDWIAQLMHDKDRTKAGATAPACGLYLVGVDYPDAFELDAGQPGDIFPPVTPLSMPT